MVIENGDTRGTCAKFALFALLSFTTGTQRLTYYNLIYYQVLS